MNTTIEKFYCYNFYDNDNVEKYVFWTYVLLLIVLEILLAVDELNENLKIKDFNVKPLDMIETSKYAVLSSFDKRKNLKTYLCHHDSILLMWLWQEVAQLSNLEEVEVDGYYDVRHLLHDQSQSWFEDQIYDRWLLSLKHVRYDRKQIHFQNHFLLI